MDDLKLIREALEAINRRQVVEILDDIDLALAALDRIEKQEPVAWLFQHEDTGLKECVELQQVEWGFENNNPRWQKIGPLYTAPPAAPAVPDGWKPHAIDWLKGLIQTEEWDNYVLRDLVGLLSAPKPEASE